MIKIDGPKISIRGNLEDLLTEAVVIVHAMANNIREAAEENGLDAADRLKEFSDELVDGVFMTDGELAEKKKAEFFADLDDADLPEELKNMIKNSLEKLQEKIREKEAEDGGNADDIEMPF